MRGDDECQERLLFGSLCRLHFWEPPCMESGHPQCSPPWSIHGRVPAGKGLGILRSCSLSWLHVRIAHGNRG